MKDTQHTPKKFLCHLTDGSDELLFQKYELMTLDEWEIADLASKEATSGEWRWVRLKALPHEMAAEIERLKAENAEMRNSIVRLDEIPRLLDSVSEGHAIIRGAGRTTSAESTRIAKQNIGACRERIRQIRAEARAILAKYPEDSAERNARDAYSTSDRTE